jgi:hypothetical protein
MALALDTDPLNDAFQLFEFVAGIVFAHLSSII